MRLTLSSVLSKVWFFIELDPFGPRGESGSVIPVKVEFDQAKGVWVVICRFRRAGRELKARVVIDDAEGNIIGYEELEG